MQTAATNNNQKENDIGLPLLTLYDTPIKDYITLLKPRVSLLVVFSAAAGLIAAPGHIHPYLGFITLFCVALSSGASGAINMWVERDSDALMSRTKTRPLPMGRIAPDSALAYGVILNLFAFLLQGLAVNWLSAAWLLFASLFYIFIYTILLKKRTPQNIVIGGAAGAFPPLIGWTAVTASHSLQPVIVNLEPFFYFLIIFLWTPPHFWALALYKSEDYKKAGIPMLPNTHGEAETCRQIMIYTIFMAVSSFLPVIINGIGSLYLFTAIPLNLIFILLAQRLKRTPHKKNAMQLFSFSILYLFVLFTALIIQNI